MYFSKIIFNAEHAGVRQSLSSRYRIHQYVMGGFAGRKPDRVLFRYESDPAPYALVYSDLRPDWSLLGSSLRNYQLKEFAAEFSKGMKCRFKLVANTTKRQERKRIGLVTEDDQMNWLTSRASGLGFNLVQAYIAGAGIEKSIKPAPVNAGAASQEDIGCPLIHRYAVFEGELEVTDPLAFRRTLQAGIGPAKGFGYGMLTLAR